MRYQPLLLLASLLPLRGPALAQQPAPAADPYAGEVKTLQQEYSKAQQAYYEPITKAKTDAERQKVRLDPARNPTPLFLPKFQELAQKADGTKSGATATWMVASLATDARNPEVAREAYRSLFSKYSETQEAERAILGLRYAGYSIGEDESRKILRDILDGSANRKMKAAALFTLAEKNMDHLDSAGVREETRGLFDQLKQNYGESVYAKEADRAIFEMDNLQVGKVAPDFQATDQTGKKFKLSDYRGKVVVLDFWGYW